jgi:hypothetical protein
MADLATVAAVISAKAIGDKDGHTTRISSLQQFIDQIMKATKWPTRELVFRGQSNFKWNTLASLFRNDAFQAYEHDMCRDLMAYHPEEFQADANMFERLVRMQHYGLPTRLVDVTLNPLIGLYFACDAHVENGHEVDGRVIAYYVPRHSRMKYYDSDTVSVLANLANISDRDKYILEIEANKFDNEEWAGYTDDKRIELFNKKAPVKRLVRFVRQEKPSFESIVDPRHLYRPIYVKPRLTNKRIVAQSGAFLLYGFQVDPSENRFDRNIAQWYYQIPADKKKGKRCSQATALRSGFAA